MLTPVERASLTLFNIFTGLFLSVKQDPLRVYEQDVTLLLPLSVLRFR